MKLLSSGLLAFGALVLAVPVALSASGARGDQAIADLRPVASFDSIPDRTARSVAIFEEMGRVIQHPRCVNCHPRTDRPLQGDDQHLHNPPVTRGPDGHGAAGMECSTCHGPSNVSFATGEGSIPGHPEWHVAPIEMAWEGKTLGQICEQIKDPARNGGKTLAQIAEHNAHDGLVGWGWNPGDGRTPVPGTQAQFGALSQAWVESGAACPTE